MKLEYAIVFSFIVLIADAFKTETAAKSTVTAATRDGKDTNQAFIAIPNAVHEKDDDGGLAERDAREKMANAVLTLV